MILEDIDKENSPPVIIFAPAERLDCKYCGKEYVSRGKRDPGYCRACGVKMQTTMYSPYMEGGPLNDYN